MRKFILAILIMLGAMFIISQFAEIEDIVNTLREGDWHYLSLALICELLWIFNLGASFKAIFGVVGVQENLKRLVLLATAANFVNTIAPSAGIGGIAVFISEARSRKYSTGKATVATTLFLLFDYTAFFVILTLGFVVLLRRDQLTPAEITASIILVLIALGLAALLVLGFYSEKRLGSVLAWIARLINRIVRPIRSKKHKEYLSEERAFAFSQEVADGVREIKHKPRDLFLPVLLALNSKILMILVLYCVFVASKVPISIGTLIAGFSVSFLFSVVSPTPSGVGIVEGILPLALNSFYIPLGTAVIITLMFRAFTFWLPLFFGMAAFRWVGKS